MARRTLRTAIASFVGALDVAPASTVEPARDAVPDNANELFTGRGAGIFGFGTGVLVNALTRAGTQQDSSFWARWVSQRFLGRQEHFALGRNALSFQALAKIGDTATREWWTVDVIGAEAENKKEIADKILDYETRLGLENAVPNACRRGRQYGDSIILLGILDGREPDQPVDVANLQTIKWAAVIDRRDFDYESVAGPESDDFGKPSMYRITRLDGILQDGIRFYGEGTTNFSLNQLQEFYQTDGQLLIHADRVLRFPTVDALSALDTIQDALEGYLESTNGLKNAARDAGTVVYKISKLIRKRWHENGGQVATDHIRAVHAGKAAANAYIIDKDDEDVSSLPNNLAGVADAINPMMVWLAAALNLPVTEFWQVSPGGFGTGDSEATRMHVAANAFQKMFIFPEMRKAHGYMLVAKDGGINLPQDTRRKIIPGDLSPPDEETRSKLRSETIDDMIKLGDSGYISRAEIRNSIPSDDLFSVQLEEDDDELAEAAVGVWTGTIALASAMFPGGVPEEFAAYLGSKLSPQRFVREEFLAQAQAARGTPTPGAPAAVPGDPTAALQLGDPDGEEDETDEHTQAWEAGQEPSDTKTSTELGKIFRVSPQKITSFAKRNNIFNWDTFGGRTRFSQREFEAAHMERNDTAPPQSATIMIPIPNKIAAQFPEDSERGEPHVTLLHVGDVKPSERDKILETAARVVLDSKVSKSTATLGALDYFPQPDKDRRVAFNQVDFSPSVDTLHNDLRAALESDGFEVEHHEGGFQPHATLAYLPGLESEFTGALPAGEWPITIELWYGDKRYPLPLTAPEPEILE